MQDAEGKEAQMEAAMAAGVVAGGGCVDGRQNSKDNSAGHDRSFNGYRSKSGEAWVTVSSAGPGLRKHSNSKASSSEVELVDQSSGDYNAGRVWDADGSGGGAQPMVQCRGSLCGEELEDLED